MPQVQAKKQLQYQDPEIVRYENGFRELESFSVPYFYHLSGWGVFLIADLQTHIRLRNAKLPGKKLNETPSIQKELKIKMHAKVDYDVLEKAGRELERGLTDEIILEARLALLQTLKEKGFQEVSLEKKYYVYPLLHVFSEGLAKNFSWLRLWILIQGAMNIAFSRQYRVGIGLGLIIPALFAAYWTIPHYFHLALIGCAPLELQQYGTDPLIRDAVAIERKLEAVKSNNALAEQKYPRNLPLTPLDISAYQGKKNPRRTKKISQYARKARNVFLSTFLVPELGDACALGWCIAASFYFAGNNARFWIFISLYAPIKAGMSAKSIAMAGIDAYVAKKFFTEKKFLPPAFLASKVFAFAHKKTLKTARLILPLLEVSAFALVAWNSVLLNRLVASMVETEAAISVIKMFFILLGSIPITLNANLFTIKKMQGDIRTDIAAEPYHSKILNGLARVVGGNYLPISNKTVRGMFLGVYYVATIFYLSEWRLNFFLPTAALPFISKDSFFMQRIGLFFVHELIAVSIAVAAAIPAAFNAQDAFYRFGINEKRKWGWCGGGVLEKELAGIVVENPLSVGSVPQPGLELSIPPSKEQAEMKSPADGLRSRSSTIRARVEEMKMRAAGLGTPDSNDSPRSYADIVISGLNQDQGGRTPLTEGEHSGEEKIISRRST